MLISVCALFPWFPSGQTDKQLPVLDPYILNIFPRSLLPTGGYLVTLAVLSWYLSGCIWQGLYHISQAPEEQDATLNSPRPSARTKKVA